MEMELPGQAHEDRAGATVIVVWFLELSDDVLADRVVVSGGAHIGREITIGIFEWSRESKEKTG